ncbi:GGDEF domain-containing protein [Streptomyces griseoviridis]
MASAGPLAAAWGVHGLLLRRRLSAARHDPLSGLRTRATFEARAARVLARRPHVAVALLDLDGFKALNDTHGHAAGDMAIRATAGALTDAVTECPGAVTGRLGGDEFAAVVALPSPMALPWLLRGLHDEITAPFRHGGHDLRVGVSIGAALSTDLTPVGTAAGDRLGLLLRLADEAMYAVKRSGGGWSYPGATTPVTGSTAGRRTGRDGTHTTLRKGAS